MSDKEDFIATLQACYFGDRNAFNKIVSVYDNLQKENQQLTKRYLLLESKCIDLKEVIEGVRKHCNQEIKSASIQYERDKKFMYQQYIVYHERVLQILDKVKDKETNKIIPL